VAAEGQAAAVTSARADEDDLIVAAQHGDDQAYGRLVSAYRAELHAHCYRMLGSYADAEDAVQEALLRAWRGIRGFERRSSLRAWLYTVATNACLKALERRPRRALPVDYGPAADPHQSPEPPPAELAWIEPYADRRELAADTAAAPEARYDQRESVELAFIAALQHLTPRQRAALILHDVLGYPAAQIAEMLRTTPASVYSSLQRAHKAAEGRLPHPSQQTTLRSLGDDGLRDLAGRYVDAWHRGDIDAIVAMLTSDAILSMPPLPSWFAGAAAIRAFLATLPMTERDRSRLVATCANGQLAFGHYLLDGGKGRYLAHSVDVLTLRGSRIAVITAFKVPDLFRTFGLSPSTGNTPR
jgi:RNA polymerase sigma-70 factor (ECF subfamily)